MHLYLSLLETSPRHVKLLLGMSTLLLYRSNVPAVLPGAQYPSIDSTVDVVPVLEVEHATGYMTTTVCACRPTCHVRMWKGRKPVHLNCCVGHAFERPRNVTCRSTNSVLEEPGMDQKHASIRQSPCKRVREGMLVEGAREDGSGARQRNAIITRLTTMSSSSSISAAGSRRWRERVTSDPHNFHSAQVGWRTRG